MTVALVQPDRAAARSARRLRLGPPMLDEWWTRYLRRLTVAYVLLLMLGGWALSMLFEGGIFDGEYAWLAVGGYLTSRTVIQLLSVLPTVRRATE